MKYPRRIPWLFRVGIPPGRTARPHPAFAVERLEERTVLSATWPASFGGSGHERPLATALFADGSSLVTGCFQGSAVFGDITLASVAGSFDMFIAKLNADASVAWARRIGGQGYDDGTAIHALSDGSAIVTGCFSGTASFGSTTLTSAGGRDAFVTKITADGVFSWTRRLGFASDDCGCGVSELQDGSLLVAGNGRGFKGEASLTDSDIFIARLTPNGDFSWVKSAGGAGTDYCYAVTATPDGSCVVAGCFSGTATFGTHQLTSSGDLDAFAAKLAPDGTFTWVRRAGGTGGDELVDATALPDGSTIFSGSVKGRGTFGSTPFGNDDQVSHGFVAKLNSAGGLAWITTLGGDGSSYVNGVAATADGAALVTGGFVTSIKVGQSTLTSLGEGDIFVAKLDRDGVFAWGTRAGGTGFDWGSDIKVFNDGSAVISGQFSNTVAFGGATLQGRGQRDAFVARITANGVWGVVPNAPRGVFGTPGNGQVRLTWSAPVSNGGSPITDYVVQYKASTATDWITANDGTSTATSATVTGLTNGTPYLFRVSAVNGAGTGEFSTPTAPVTPRTVPTAPLNLIGTPGNGQVRLTWSAPLSNGGSPLTDYIVQYRTSTASQWIRFPDGVSTATSATVTGLTNGTPYVFRVSAVNAAGMGAWSAETLPITPRTVATAPLNLIGTPGNGQVNLTWSAPSSNGGSAITDYVVQYRQSSASTWLTFADGTSIATSVTVTGLTNGTPYVFRVSAVNGAGIGAYTAPTLPITPRTVATAPRNLVSTVGNGQARLTWTAPSSTGGSAIMDYVIEYRASTASQWIRFADGTSTATSATVTGLTNGTPYVFRVSAVNGAGVGAYTAPTLPITPRTVATAPTNLVGTAGSGRVSLTWSAPVSNGGSPITDYVVQYRPSTASTWLTFSDGTSTATSATITGLTNGTAYVFRVSAVNGAGIGVYTPTAVTATPVLNQDAVAGRWNWFNGDSYEFLADGQVIRYMPDGTIKYRADASWRHPDANPRRYLFTWGNGEYRDDLILSSDGKTLQGTNQYGNAVSGQRIS